MSNLGMKEISFVRREQKSNALDFRKVPILARRKIPHAELPALYKEAQAALKECSRVDEIKEIKDRHDAIAHYAKQVKDTTLLYYAERIKLRAIIRIGELLNELPDGASRNQLAKDHGLALGVARKAEDIATIPKRVQEQMVESTPPPSYTKMAEQARRAYGANDYGSRFSQYTRKESMYAPTVGSCAEELSNSICETIREWQRILVGMNGISFRLRDVVRSIPSEEASFLRERIGEIWAFLDEVDQYLPSGDE